MTGLYHEDYTVGRVFETSPVTLDADEITWFAKQYDPQPFHTDAESAKGTVFGGLIASGFQTVAVATGQFISTGAVVETGMGGPGLDEIRWIAPVRPGDSLRTVVTVAEARVSKSKPDRGVVRLSFSVSTDAGEVATFYATIMVRCRRAGSAGDSAA
ncbi:MAG: acyl dehydratase [Alphaproteobacteria bacterium]|nr:acyl dehydratase [Alphaproteobacteria bacterium]|tara:strand:+ start:1431 stop:1901 length:471 start_codon:yes stop_codon:yes gene_type:complete